MKAILMATHVDDEEKGVAKRDTLGGSQQMTIINESGLFMRLAVCKDKLKSLLNRYGKDNANHDKGAIAVPFSELVNCKK